MIGNILDGRYRIVRRLGDGGMGSVYEAVEQGTSRKVAVKVIKPGELSADPAAVSRFKREARLAGAIHTDHIARIFDAGTDPATGQPYMVMEYLEGEDLRAIIERVGPLPPDVAIAIVSQACRGLVRAHEAHVIHRDIKPANIFLARNGDGSLQVKLIDFGVAKLAAEGHIPGETTGLTQSSSMLGSPLYMSPEQARGSRDIDHRADLWSLGVVLYRALTGQTPHGHAQALGELIIAICSEPARPVQELAPWVSADVASVVHRALCIEADDRYQSAGEMLADLERLVPGEPDLDAGRLTPVSDADRARVEPLSPQVLHDRSRTGERSRASAKTARPVAATPARRSRLRTPLLAGAALLTGMGLALAMGRVTDRRTPAPPAMLPLPAASAPRRVPVTELPRPSSPSQDALRAYAEGLASLRDGMMKEALQSFTRATELDPGLAAAHLHLAVWSFIFDPSVGRKHFQEARTHRASLSARDQAFFEAMQPAILRDPSDWAAAAQNLEAMAERFPGDADLYVWLHCTYELDGRMTESMRALDMSIAADPAYALPWNAKGEQLLYEGDVDGGMAALDRCLTLSPASAYCAQEALWMVRQRGACDDYEARARRWIAADPASPGGYEHLATALYARGTPVDGVVTALEQAWQRTPEAERKLAEMGARIRTDVLTGDLADAAARVETYAAMTADRPDIEEHGRVARLRAALALETGRPADAARAAEEFLRRKGAWTVDPRADDWAVAKDPTPLMLAALRSAGKLSPEAFGAERDAWVGAWNARPSAWFAQRVLWLHGYAAVAESAAEAAAALDVLARSPVQPGIPPFRPLTALEGAVGRTYLLAGRVPEAVTWLRTAVAQCTALDFPIEHTRAHLWLGQALEAAGDDAGACASYRVVLDRWGKARPRSLSAELARDRMKARRCPP